MPHRDRRAPPPHAPRSTRIESLDVLRGFAVLGIYAVNVQAFALPPHIYANPMAGAGAGAGFDAAGQAVWTLIVTLFQMKFITIFTALFGAGIILMSGEGADEARTRLHVRRMWWLFAIGLVHAYGFWYGDILAPYAVAGLLLTGVRGLSVRMLVAAGVALVLATNVIYAIVAGSMAMLPPEDYAELVAESWAPPPEAVAEQIALFRSAWPARVRETAELVFSFQLDQMLLYLPRFCGTMMIGMALQKTGFFTGGWRASRYLMVGALAPLGALGSWAAARMLIAAEFDFAAMIPGESLLFLVSVPQAFGYAALVVLACRPRALAGVRAPFAAAGRAALSAYLGCTLVSWFVFFGPPGLGLIGELSRLEQARFAAWVCVGVLAFAWAWLAVFRFGPVEWAWRSLTYGRRQPFVRPA